MFKKKSRFHQTFIKIPETDNTAQTSFKQFELIKQLMKKKILNYVSYLDDDTSQTSGFLRIFKLTIKQQQQTKKTSSPYDIDNFYSF